MTTTDIRIKGWFVSAFYTDTYMYPRTYMFIITYGTVQMLSLAQFFMIENTVGMDIFIKELLKHL